MASILTSVVGDIWPLDSCNDFSARPILPNTSKDRVCGIQTSNSSLLNACCNGGIVRQYQCWMFCSYPDTYSVQDFGECIAKTETGTNSTSGIGGSSVFCEGNVTSSEKASLSNGTAGTSFGTRSSSVPKLSWVVLALLFSLCFIGPASATTIPSPGNELFRRQGDGGTDCTFNVQGNYAISGSAFKVSDTMRCSVEVCYGTLPIDTGMNGLNRTLNSTSAADPSYDAFFDVISNATQGRRFPAQSRLQMDYSFGATGAGYFLTFIPFHWCVNGTATKCKGIYGDTDDAQQVTACGPLFVSDANSNRTAGVDDDEDVVQGSMRIVAVS